MVPGMEWIVVWVVGFVFICAWLAMLVGVLCYLVGVRQPGAVLMTGGCGAIVGFTLVSGFVFVLWLNLDHGAALPQHGFMGGVSRLLLGGGPFAALAVGAAVGVRHALRNPE